MTLMPPFIAHTWLILLYVMVFIILPLVMLLAK